MNEKIKELVKQADAYAHNKLAEIGGSYLEYYNEKFAELIVRECVKVAMRSVSDDEPKEAWYLIQEHFGVK